VPSGNPNKCAMMIDPDLIAFFGASAHSFRHPILWAAIPLIGLLVFLLPYKKRVFILVISTAVFAACWLRNLVVRLAGRELPGRCVVLYYHAVPVQHKPRFERQMDDLLRFAEPTTAARRSPLGSEKRYAVVTFDDAYQNILVNALPALKTRRIPAAVFVVPDMLGRTPSLSDPSTVSADERKVMSVEDLQSLLSDWVTIGSHSLTHPHLTTLSLKEAAHELTESRRVLEEIVQRPVQLFCFPYGECSEELFRICREAGYERVFTSIPQFAFSEPAEFVTARVRVDPTDWRLEFRLKLLGAYGWLPVAVAIKRRIFGQRVETPTPQAIVPNA
jgi:peptidoglycan/xylan/chitin deacetylase (PgdA/CDA1 family)